MFGENDAPSKFIPFVINKLKSNEQYLELTAGEQTRDFTFVENVVQANIKAIFTDFDKHEVYNIACGERISINKLWENYRAMKNYQ